MSAIPLVEDIASLVNFFLCVQWVPLLLHEVLQGEKTEKSANQQLSEGLLPKVLQVFVRLSQSEGATLIVAMLWYLSCVYWQGSHSSCEVL